VPSRSRCWPRGNPNTSGGLLPEGYRGNRKRSLGPSGGPPNRLHLSRCLGCADGEARRPGRGRSGSEQGAGRPRMSSAGGHGKGRHSRGSPPTMWTRRGESRIGGTRASVAAGCPLAGLPNPPRAGRDACKVDAFATMTRLFPLTERPRKIVFVSSCAEVAYLTGFILLYFMFSREGGGSALSHLHPLCLLPGRAKQGN